MLITKIQNKILHKLLNDTGLTDHKDALVSSQTNGRTESSRELTMHEAQSLITWLKAKESKEDGSNRMRRKILSIFHRMEWQTNDGKIDMKRIDEWCKNKSYLHKPLMEYSSSELVKLVNQVQGFYTRHQKQVG